ncbi:DsbC family protein [uncultured Lamprocystis sp.]|jgi:thiol:disulfide interchange protein DsbC|uniref:DsbC family protein n=1 Tax=uncultured Lamprocystis sp. TaxID=543132 RepID=UPI0025EFFDD2|nr:DsbC family protein [uncultured Lamprocystis sp.]
MRPVRIVWVLLAGACAAPPLAAWSGVAPGATPGTPLGADAPAIRRLARLPIQGLQAVETTDGQLLYVSDNGRYLIRGTAYDLWHGAELTSLAQEEDLAGRIDLKRLKLDPADLGALATGTGPTVLAFVDPHCPHCADLLADLPSLTARYRFRLIPLPIGTESQAAVLALHCLASTDPAVALKALFEHTDLPPGSTTGCGQGTAQRALVTAQLLGVRGTPFLIAPDGRLHQGRPGDLAGWLAEGGTAGAGEGGQ